MKIFGNKSSEAPKKKMRLTNIAHGAGGAYVSMSFDTTGYTKATIKNINCYAEALGWRYSEVVFMGTIICTRGGKSSTSTWTTGTTTVAEVVIPLNGATTAQLQLNTINAEANCSVGEIIFE